MRGPTTAAVLPPPNQAIFITRFTHETVLEVLVRRDVREWWTARLVYINSRMSGFGLVGRIRWPKWTTVPSNLAFCRIDYATTTNVKSKNGDAASNMLSELRTTSRPVCVLFPPSRTATSQYAKLTTSISAHATSVVERPMYETV